MSGRNFLLSAAAAVLTALFLPSTLQSKGITAFASIPTYYIYVGYSAVAVVGMVMAYYLGRMIPILWQLAKFGLIGVLNTAIDFGILNLMSGMAGVTSGVGLIPIKAISFSIALINSYFWNKGWVFEGKKKANPLTFAIVSTLGLIINVGTIYILTTIIGAPGNMSPALWLNIANVGATGLSMVWNYLGYRLVVFKK
jgi:putative flippase GtrA